MSINDDFSLEQSEELIANLKSGKPSEFEQLRSTLSLLAHVPELPPTSIPPVLPSTISQPVPVLPVKSAKPRRTIVTSIMVVGLFASASLAAAAVTGIGPAVIVNAGHQAARLVKGVVSGVAQVVTGNAADATQEQASPSQVLGANPSESLAPFAQEDANPSDSQLSPLAIPLLGNLLPPVSTALFPPVPTTSNENDSENSNSSRPIQGPTVEVSPPEATQSPNENQDQSSPQPSEQPTPDPSDEPSTDPSSEATPESTDQPTPDASVPSPDETDTPEPTN